MAQILTLCTFSRLLASVVSLFPSNNNFGYGSTHLSIHVSCVHLADKIVELEEHIATLGQIQESEKLMDSIIFGRPHTDTTCAKAMDVNAPWLADSVPATAHVASGRCLPSHCVG